MKLDRLAWVDRVRGLAVVLMVLDHVLAATSSGTFLRYTLTRASLPLFMVLTGWLHATRQTGPSPAALHRLALYALGAAVLVSGLPYMGHPDVLVLIAFAWVVLPLVLRAPALAICLGLVQVTTWPMWGGQMTPGYQPGHIVALVAAGVVLSGCEVTALARLGDRLPSFFGSIGRRPLLVYVGHLSVLACWHYYAHIGTGVGLGGTAVTAVGVGLGLVLALAGYGLYRGALDRHRQAVAGSC